MHSPDSSSRRLLERALHATAMAACLCAVLVVWRMLDDRDSVQASGNEVRSALERWSTSESPGRAHVSFEKVPSPELRDWVAALRGATTEVTWESQSLVATGLAVEPIADPRHPVRIWVAAPSGSRVDIRDGLGGLESVQSAKDGAGVAITAPRMEGVVHARVDDAEATGAVNDALTIKPVLLLAAAGWESKFVMAALEEYGWKVDARLALTDKQTVVQGPRLPQIDKEHYAAVIALDATASRYASAITKYVREGGGLIAAGEAVSLSAFASLFGGTAGGASQAASFTDQEAILNAPRTALALAPITQQVGEAVALERTAKGEIAALARRVGDGRVLQVGYVDTWRWRMAGTDKEPVRAHRDWWAAMLSSVAHAPRAPLSVAEDVEPTPLATTISVLGAPARMPSNRVHSLSSDPRLLPWLFAIALGALLLEWASRRLRGAP